MSRPSQETSAELSPLKQLLKRYWGYDDFLPYQQDAVRAVLAGRDSLVVLPTGGGKSLCFQAPAMHLDGLAVVVSPLISLMKDQVDALRSYGIPAACIHSMVSPAERREIADDIRAGALRLLYVAPERLVQQRTISFLEQQRVSLIAIDEAHCISAWGHDFRPEYRQLRLIKESFPAVGVHAYTATATSRVRNDICQQLGLTDPEVVIGSFDRPNLIYRVQRRSDRLKQISDVIDLHQGESGIVYCITRKEAEQITDRLNALGYHARAYHAGMSDTLRQQNQDDFIRERITTIVATIAFGMGIDKSNVRYVVHAGMPKSLEHYQQESGRAGRDRLEAKCYLFYSGQDYLTWKRMLEEMPAEARQGALDSLGRIWDYCTGVSCRHATLVEHFGQPYGKQNCGGCDVCLDELDQIADPLTVGQKILSCVVRLGQRFGGDYTAMVLIGSNDQRVNQLGHAQLSTWGILADESKRTVRDWIEQLAEQGFLEKTGEYNVLQVTEAGRQLLRGEVTPRLLKPAKTKQTRRRPAVDKDSWEGVDRDLFEDLRQLRRTLAEAKQVPAYIVFGDASLREMARECPTTLDSFGQIKGIGEKKLADYGEVFVQRIVDYTRRKK